MEKIKLFIVDDEPMSIVYFKSFFEGLTEYEIIGEAYDGKSAHAMIQKINPDIIFADISMPVMDGLSLAENLLKDNPDTKIILLTSYKDFDYVRKGLEIGVTSYLLKHQISQEILIHEIDKIMEKVLIHKEKEKKLLHYNMRNFLVAKTDMDCEVPNCLYRKEDEFLVLDLILDEPIVCQQPVPDFDHMNWSGLDQWEVINFRCRTIIHMDKNHWVAICFIKSGCSQTSLRESIMEFSYHIQSLFLAIHKTVSVIISRTTSNFYQLPLIYQELPAYRDVLYTKGVGQIVFQTEMKVEKGNKILTEMTMQLLHALEEGEEEGCHFINYMLDSALESGSLKEFQQMIKDIDKIITHFLKKQKIEFKIDTSDLQLYTIEETKGWLVHIVRESFSKIQNNKTYSTMIKEALYYMEENYANNISIQDIAIFCNSSESHLRKKFKQETGNTIVDYLTILRINKAKYIMKTSNYKVVDIYKLVGFTSSQYFSNVFKKIEGISPSDYKNKI